MELLSEPLNTMAIMPENGVPSYVLRSHYALFSKNGFCTCHTLRNRYREWASFFTGTTIDASGCGGLQRPIVFLYTPNRHMIQITQIQVLVYGRNIDVCRAREAMVAIHATSIKRTLPPQRQHGSIVFLRWGRIIISACFIYFRHSLHAKHNSRHRWTS